MKQTIKDCLILAAIFAAMFICLVFFFFLGNGIMWLINKLNAFLNQLCFNWYLNISPPILNAISFGFVATIIIMVIGGLVYFFLFRKTTFIEE